MTAFRSPYGSGFLVLPVPGRVEWWVVPTRGISPELSEAWNQTLDPLARPYLALNPQQATRFPFGHEGGSRSCLGRCHDHGRGVTGPGLRRDPL
jgi:hypothetical protein